MQLLEYGKNVSDAAKQAVTALESESLKVFYTDTFTVSPAKNPYRVFGDELGKKTADGSVVNIVVDGSGHIEQCRADYLDYGDYITDEGNVIKKEGSEKAYFAESLFKQSTKNDDPAVTDFRSAPYFDLIIDGIDPLN